ncbi:MAG: DUF4232 domain-containing protein [Solirubrobacteraceae bacterium]
MARSQARAGWLVSRHGEDLTAAGTNILGMRISSIGGGLLAAIALAACGSGGSHPAAATVTTTTTSAGSPTTSTASTSTATATATATASATTSGAAGSGSGSGSGGAGIGTLQGSTPECKAAGLSISYLGQQGATGNGEVGFALHNTGGTCVTGGYPGVQFLDHSGAALPTHPTRATSDFFGNLRLQRVVLHTGQTASFRLAVSHGGGGSSSGCTIAYGLQVIAPDDTASMSVQIPGGAAECGDVSVSPMQPGTSAYR